MKTTSVRLALVATAALFAGFFVARLAPADEGMWLYFNPPVERIKEKYGVELTPEALDHLRKSSLRFATYGSASFVSSNGLVMTNHHVGEMTVNSLSSEENNLARDGFIAEKLEDEIKCPRLKLRMLSELIDVTDRVKEASASAEDEESANRAEREASRQIAESASSEKGLICEVQSYFAGSLYLLYCYKEFDDVRLVFSPEKNVGFFGGDADDFSYPRYNLDAAFFRVYENDEPYRPEHFLKWSENGASEDEFVLVSGHPARTDRYKSVAEWKFLRDVYYPRLIDKYRREEATYSLYKAIEEENNRSVENPRAFPTRRRRNDEATLQSLQAGSVMGAKIAAEEELRRLAKERGALDFSQGDPWEKLEEVFRERSETYLAGDLVDSLFELSGRALSRAETIVDLIEDASKPVDQRERYVDDDEIAAQRERLEVETRREFGAFDELRLSDALDALFVESRQIEGGRAIGGVVVPRASFDAIFAGVSPRARAGQIARDDKIFDKEFVASLLDGGIEALESSDDPAIQIALALRPIRERAKEAARLVEEAKAREYPRIDRARFAVYGADGVAPNADFTLRLTYGAVADCLGNDGNVQRFSTSVRGAYDHASERGWESPFDLSPRWREAEKEGRAPMDSPLDFIATNDVTGGNSGSPAVNANGEVVGLIFDINFPMQAANYSFDPKRTRAVLVHSHAIVDLIRDVYQFPRLVDELGR